MSKPISRSVLVALYCFWLSGCTAGIVTNNLRSVQAKQNETRLLKSAGFIIHESGGDAVFGVGDSKSWVDALSEFTNMENIFFADIGQPDGMIHSFAEFSKTHPIVSIELKKSNFEFIDGLKELSLLTLGIIPMYVTEPCTVSFTLTMPENKHVAPARWDYSYDRKQYDWLPLIFVADTTSSMGVPAHFDTRWKVEEKRRLLLRFLEDAKLSLQDH